MCIVPTLMMFCKHDGNREGEMRALTAEAPNKTEIWACISPKICNVELPMGWYINWLHKAWGKTGLCHPIRWNVTVLQFGRGLLSGDTRYTLRLCESSDEAGLNLKRRQSHSLFRIDSDSGCLRHIRSSDAHDGVLKIQQTGIKTDSVARKKNNCIITTAASRELKLNLWYSILVCQRSRTIRDDLGKVAQKIAETWKT